MEKKITFHIPLDRFRILGVLAAMSFIGTCLFVLKVLLFKHWLGIYLHLNLILGWMPLFVALWASKQNSKTKLLFITILWLLFFPNAPYIITDFIHLYPGNNPLYWIYLCYLFIFALTSLACGLVSLYWMQQVWKRVYSQATYYLFFGGSLMLSGYGIFLGRMGRWNSWDVIVQPKQLLINILLSTHNKEAWLMTVEFSALMMVCYLLFWGLINLKTNQE